MVDKLGIPKGNVLRFQLRLENTGGIIAVHDKYGILGQEVSKNNHFTLIVTNCLLLYTLIFYMLSSISDTYFTG